MSAFETHQTQLIFQNMSKISCCETTQAVQQGVHTIDVRGIPDWAYLREISDISQVHNQFNLTAYL